MDAILESEIKKIIEAECLNCKVEEFRKKADWHEISSSYNLSEDFIKEFQHEVDWRSICRNQELSEDFLREYQGLFSWEIISYRQKLSEDFIREFRSKVDWWGISACQDLSEDFIKEFEGKLNIHVLPEINGKPRPYICCKCKKLLDGNPMDRIGKIFIRPSRKDSNIEIELANEITKNEEPSETCIENYVCETCADEYYKPERNKAIKSGLTTFPFILIIVIIAFLLTINFFTINGKFHPAAGLIIIPLLGFLLVPLKKVFGMYVSEKWSNDKVVMETYVKDKKDYSEQGKLPLDNMEITTCHEINGDYKSSRD